MHEILSRLRGLLLTIVLISTLILSFAKGDPGGLLHLASGGSEFSSVYLFLFFIISGAVAGRFVARKLKQPEVLGELLFGVIIGAVLFQLNFPEMILLRHQQETQEATKMMVKEGISLKEALESISTIDEREKETLIGIAGDERFSQYDLTIKSILLFSNLGVLILLFLVGLESSIEEMMRVGGPSMSTAVTGVVVPSLLGTGISYLLLPEKGMSLHLFIGAALSATSIGITARVFRDLNKVHLPESKIVLGAAVIDDVLGLILLAVVTGIVKQGSIDALSVAVIFGKSVLFLGITLYVGSKFLRQQVKVAAIIDNRNLRLLFPFALLILLAWISEAVGLSGIVGAFAAGLIVKEEYFNEALKDKERSVKQVIEPVESIFAPVFFVLMGIQVDISAFANTTVLGLALLLTIAAIFGKLVSGVFTKGLDRKVIGIGMIPRGEVGLIFAGIGKSIGVLDGNMFSTVVIIVILTTLITPPALKWAFDGYDSRNNSK